MWQVLCVLSLNVPSRQSVRTSSALISIPKLAKSYDDVDEYTHWSFYGLVAPPIEKVLSYDELVAEINHDKIKSIQISVQHDRVIATINEGHA
tara:strand:- start:908 stop:1186 length:279 start_codon:yes stop_codon:yes gene_type:complete